MDQQVQARLISAARVGQVPEDLPDGLTRREAEVLALIGAGLGNAEIAERMHLSRSTVKTHINRIFAKTRVSGRAAAIEYARHHDIASPRRYEIAAQELER